MNSVSENGVRVPAREFAPVGYAYEKLQMEIRLFYLMFKVIIYEQVLIYEGGDERGRTPQVSKG